jgi:flagellar hook protein FlgE
LQTQSLGSSPTGSSGGTNPRQIGLGVQVAEITPDFGQGTIQISANPSDLAIQGDGFFIVEGNSGERLFSRNGVFKTNSENELVTITGNRLLGHGVDESFRIQATELVPLTIPVGSTAVMSASGPDGLHWNIIKVQQHNANNDSFFIMIKFKVKIILRV